MPDCNSEDKTRVISSDRVHTPRGFSRAYSLKRNKEFRSVYRNGKSKASRSLVLIYRRQGNNIPKIGFSVSKKLGNSVARNRIKRRMRAALTPLLGAIKPGARLIFIARAPIINEDFQDLRRDFRMLIDRAELTSTTAKSASDKRMGE